jgi:hypothetical protein
MTELTGIELQAVSGGDGTQDADHAAMRAYGKAQGRAYGDAMSHNGTFAKLIGWPLPTNSEYRDGINGRFTAAVDDANARRAAVANGGLMGAITIPRR